MRINPIFDLNIAVNSINQNLLINLWMKCIDNGDLTGTLFLDFHKAVDLVDHEILLNKLSLYKFNPFTLRWFESHLDCRQQTI